MSSLSPPGGPTAIRLPFGQKWIALVLCCVSLALGVGLGGPFMGLFKTESAQVHRSSLQEVFSHAEESGPHYSQRHTKTHFQARCPVEFDRLSISEMRAGQVKPYLFGEPKHPPCPTCELHSRYGACMYWGGIPACRPREQAKLLQYFLNETKKGSAFAEGMMTLTPCDMWPFIRGRTLWLAGDSITQETMRAAECFFLPFWNGTVTPPSSNQTAINHSMTHGQVPPWCIEMPENSRVCHIRVNLPEKMVGEVMPVLEGLSVKPSDIFVYNSAVWINDEEEYRTGLEQFAAAYKKEIRRMPFMIWRDSSVQHFNTPTGDYSVKGSPPPCMPVGLNLTEDAIRLLPDGRLASDRQDLQVVLEGGWRNRIASPIMQELGIPIMHTWNQTLPLWWTKNHYNPKCGLDDYWCGDCTHACHPSMYQIWFYHLYEVLLANQQRLVRHFSIAKPSRS